LTSRAAVICSLVLASATVQDREDAALVSASAGRTVRVRFGSSGTSRILDLPMELYVARVLAAEGEPRAEVAAQHALAIVVRTFATVNARRHRRDGFDLCDTTHCQVLRPFTPATREAALATAGQLLTYEGRPAEVFYSASCGGRSEAVSQVWTGATDLPYLRSADDDVHDADAPWVLELPIGRVEEALRRAGFDGPRLKDVSVERRSPSRRVTRLHLSGMRPAEISGEDFRAALGARELRSTQFSVETTRGILRFTGHGYGHGVGMCVVGAGRRAARGEMLSQILEQYYPGLKVQPVAALSFAPLMAPAPEHEPARVPGSVATAASRVRDELAAALGIGSPPALQVQVHETLEAFRLATGRPWWTAVVVEGASIDLAPMPILAQQDGAEAAIRRGVAEALVREALADRPAWVRIGAARYYGSAQRPAPTKKNVRCPSDAELMMALSASALRDAELRAESCFARALAKTGDWRAVR